MQDILKFIRHKNCTEDFLSNNIYLKTKVGCLSDRNFTGLSNGSEFVFSLNSVGSSIAEPRSSDFELNDTLSPAHLVLGVVDDLHLVLEPSDFWSWAGLQCAGDGARVAEHNLSVVESSGELGVDIEVHLWVSWLDVGSSLLEDSSELLGGSSFSSADFVDGSDSELVVVSEDELIDVGIAVSDLVVDDVPLAVGARSLISLINRVAENVKVAIVGGSLPLELDRSADSLDDLKLSWLRRNVHNSDINGGGSREILNFDIDLVGSSFSSGSVSDKDDRRVASSSNSERAVKRLFLNFSWWLGGLAAFLSSGDWLGPDFDELGPGNLWLWSTLEGNIDVDFVVDVDLQGLLEVSWEENLGVFDASSAADWAKSGPGRRTSLVLGAHSEHVVLSSSESNEVDGALAWVNVSGDGFLPAFLSSSCRVGISKATREDLKLNDITVNTSGTDFFGNVPLELNSGICLLASSEGSDWSRRSKRSEWLSDIRWLTSANGGVGNDSDLVGLTINKSSGEEVVKGGIADRNPGALSLSLSLDSVRSDGGAAV